MKMTGNRIAVAGIAGVIVMTVLTASANTLFQPAFAHSLSVQPVDVHETGERQVTIILGHANEPAYGVKPGIHDGSHAFEVELEDTATALPLTEANLTVDKYYFADFGAFERANSVEDAAEAETGVPVVPVFGDPGHYMARQVIKDGIYGYRLYGNISYFGVASLNIDSTVFCTSAEGNTTKFNSPGWFGGFGCPENIEGTLFPEKNSDVNHGNNGDISYGDPSVSAIQQVSIGQTQTAGNNNVDVAGLASMSPIQTVAFAAIPAGAVAGIFGLRSARNRRDEDQ